MKAEHVDGVYRREKTYLILKADSWVYIRAATLGYTKSPRYVSSL